VVDCAARLLIVRLAMPNQKPKNIPNRVTFTLTEPERKDAEQYRRSLIPVLSPSAFSKAMFQTGIMAHASGLIRKAKKGAVS
jgi:hypothetical protein